MWSVGVYHGMVVSVVSWGYLVITYLRLASLGNTCYGDGGEAQIKTDNEGSYQTVRQHCNLCRRTGVELAVM